MFGAKAIKELKPNRSCLGKGGGWEGYSLEEAFFCLSVSLFLSLTASKKRDSLNICNGWLGHKNVLHSCPSSVLSMCPVGTTGTGASVKGNHLG